VAKSNGVVGQVGPPSRLVSGLGSGLGLTGGGAASDSDFAGSYPFLHTFLTAVVDDDGKARRTATLMLFAEDCRFRAVLHERQHGLSLWRDAEEVKACLDGLEAALASGRAEWRRDAKSRKP